MCGIVGYVGTRQAAPLLVEGLRRLEYRGYDSAGLAVLTGSDLSLRRSVGKLSGLVEKLESLPLHGSVGLGHTRWATHGGPTERNAHPHADCTRDLALVHNGIIENYAELKGPLQARGHRFESDTDTEIVAHLVEEKLAALRETGPADPTALFAAGVRAALGEVRGAYALAVVWSGAPGVIVAAKTASPLVVGMGEGEAFLASDVPAFLDHTRKVAFLDDGELAVLSADGVRFENLQGQKLAKPPVEIEWDRAMAEKAGYPHFMLKEIHEQPLAIANTVRGRLGPAVDQELKVAPDELRRVTDVQFVACGTACHAGMVGSYLFERFAGVPTTVHLASEFRYRRPIVRPGTLVVAISQSGETADTLAAVREAKSLGAQVLSICNSVGSAVTRASDYNLYTRCGPECGVASTKAFTGQLAALHVLALRLAEVRGGLPEAAAAAWSRGLSALPSAVEEALKLDAQVQSVASRFFESEHCIYLGRNLNYPTALEGALKLKEISYIHAEGFAAGEMKHGPIALIAEGTPVVAIATSTPIFEKVLSNIEEAKARGARVIAVCSEGETRLDGKADELLVVPRVDEHLSPIVNSVPLQLLAYHVAKSRGCDIDQPRNLAKSVTVE